MRATVTWPSTIGTVRPAQVTDRSIAAVAEKSGLICARDGPWNGERTIALALPGYWTSDGSSIGDKAKPPPPPCVPLGEVKIAAYKPLLKTILTEVLSGETRTSLTPGCCLR